MTIDAKYQGAKYRPGANDPFRMVNREQARQRWDTGVAEDKADLIPPEWFDAWADATFADRSGRCPDEPGRRPRAQRRRAGRS